MAYASAQLPLFLKAHPLSRGQQFPPNPSKGEYHHTMILWSSGLKEG